MGPPLSDTDRSGLIPHRNRSGRTTQRHREPGVLSEYFSAIRKRSGLLISREFRIDVVCKALSLPCIWWSGGAVPLSASLSTPPHDSHSWAPLLLKQHNNAADGSRLLCSFLLFTFNQYGRSGEWPPPIKRYCPEMTRIQ